MLLMGKCGNFDCMQLALCTTYSSKLNSNSRNVEHLACSIYQFVDLAHNIPLRQPTKATHPHHYNMSALFTQWLILANTQVSSVKLAIETYYF